MKQKSGTVRLCLFLISVLLYSSLFSQLVVLHNQYATSDAHTLNAALIINSGSIFFKSSSLSGKFIFENFTPSVSDTTRKTDRDGDGIIDSIDKCPDEKGVIQYDGCAIPDSDNDGIADDSDNCPAVAGLAKYKGCPAPDKDGDKINDEDDKCPNQPGVARYEGCLVADMDGDGVNDDDDKCANVRGPVNNAGCPENKKSASPAGKDKRKKKE